jgi:PAS domain S-box-containing protein
VAGPRILVVGADEPTRDRYVVELRDAGLSAEGRGGAIHSSEGAELILVAGGYPGSRRDRSGALMDAVAESRKRAGLAAVLACVPREDKADAIEGSIASGADDVVICPPTQGALLARVRANLRMVVDRFALQRVVGYSAALVRMGASFETPLDGPEGIAEMLTHMVDAIGWHRAVLVLLGDEPNDLTLVAATDEPSIGRVPLTLERYPEVRACVEARQPVLVDDTAHSALLGPWAELAAKHGGAALLAVPLLIDRTAVGAVLFRSQNIKPPLDDKALDFIRLATQLFGVVLETSRILEGLRAQTRRFSKERFEQERRSRALEQYRDFFEASSDGMVVLDASGVVLYVNRAAEQMTGYAREGLAGRKFIDVVAEPQREAVLKVAQQVAEGANLEWFDLQLSTTSGEAITVSVASSSVLAEHGAAILAFRDVTEARLLEGELRKTKDFLERLIDSTVDGIIASDLRGTVIIFNQGAAQIYGYGPDEVIGKVPAWKLYPEGVARSIMSELRSGGGRMGPSRRDIVTKDGELVPVQLTASIVYEDGKEVASVGIVSDLRERLKIEERLRAAQEKLIVTEKQALIAELAGTTAHELNQPLTSVMGYAELLRKKMQPDDANFRAVDIILREAERMAEIVRKIGRITRYETKAYVGSTQILDLDKSTTVDTTPSEPRNE